MDDRRDSAAAVSVMFASQMHRRCKCERRSLADRSDEDAGFIARQPTRAELHGQRATERRQIQQLQASAIAGWRRAVVTDGAITSYIEQRAADASIHCDNRRLQTARGSTTAMMSHAAIYSAALAKQKRINHPVINDSACLHHYEHRHITWTPRIQEFYVSR